MIIEPKELRAFVQQMSEQGYLPIFGEFNDQMEEIVVEAILRAKIKGTKTLTLLINSNGGQTNVFSSIKATMLESGITFKGIVMGKAASNGFNMLQQCNERVAVRDAMLMFHWGQQQFSNQMLAAMVAGETWPVELAVEKELLYARQVSERTGVSMDDLMRFALYERYFTASQALAIHFIDSIIDDLPAKVKQALEQSQSQVE